MEPIGRSLNPEESSILGVLEQEGRGAADRTPRTIATSLERDIVDVAGVLERLKKDGLVAEAGEAESGEEAWVAVQRAA